MNINMREDGVSRLPVPRLVIVIEEQPVVRGLLGEILADLGFTSEAFDNTIQALEYLEDIVGDCALIIADQGLLGGRPGYTFINMVNECWPSIPSIVIFGSTKEAKSILLAATYLRKPYRLAQLESIILTITSYRSSDSSSAGA